MPEVSLRAETPKALRVQTAKRARSGQRFQPTAERRLESTARRMLDLTPFKSENLLAFREFHAPNGVPDITVVAPDPRRHARMALDVSPVLNSIDAAIVATATPRLGKTPEEIATKLGWRLHTVDRRLPGLVRTGALAESTPGRFIRPAELVEIGRLFAVETKIDDWQRALRQCRNYRLWAESYLLILERVPPKAVDGLRREVLRDRGGLVINGEVIVRPQVSRKLPAVRLWASEHVVAELRARSSLLRPRSR